MTNDRETVHSITDVEVAHFVTHEPDVVRARATLAAVHERLTRSITPKAVMRELDEPIALLEAWLGSRRPYLKAKP